MKSEGRVGTIVDLFSGCGGFSLGAELAGFHSLAAVDVEPVLQSGYTRNFPRTRAIQADLAQIDASDWSAIINKKTRPDGVIGGPPCQGFSSIGKRDVSDPRNFLLFDYFRHVNILKPKFFILENVQGILGEGYRDILQEALASLSSNYSVLKPTVISARNCGAATTRKRVVIIGFDPSDMPTLNLKDLIPEQSTSNPTVHEAISDLPNPIAISNLDNDLGWAAYPSNHGPISDYAAFARRCPPSHLGTQDTHDRWAKRQVSGQFETRHSTEISERYSLIASGKSDPITKSYKLDWEGSCPTLRAGTGRERGAFQAVRPLHPDQGRVITVREAARLQGFPDWFQFHPTKWQSFRMIRCFLSFESFAI